MIEIKKSYSDGYNISNRGSYRPEWIVMHYFGSLGTALATCNYFKGANRKASADFFLDDSNTYQFNPDIRKYYTWHCGGGLQGNIHHEYYGVCMNRNSIGIELRPYNDRVPTPTTAQDSGWYFHEATIKRAAELVKYLMKEYNIPEDHVIMHSNVTGKYCPAPWLDRPYEETAFMQMIRVNIDYRSQLNALYQELLGRNVDESGYQTWNAALNAGTTFAAVAEAIKGSTEYAAYQASQKTTTPIYRVRISWDEPKTQIGSFASLESAITWAKSHGSQYNVYDSAGVRVYDGQPGSGVQLEVDGSWGKATTGRIQEWLGVHVDNLIDGQPLVNKQYLPAASTASWMFKSSGATGCETIRQLQQRIGTDPDGLFGKASVKALQKFLGVSQDGSMGPATVRKLQEYLNRC